MKKVLLLFSITVLIFSCGSVSAAILDFEDLDTVSFTNPYHGFGFSGATQWEQPGADDGNYRYDGTNGNYSIASSNFGAVSISSATGDEFSLDSFFITADPGSYGGVIWYDGYRDGDLVASAAHAAQNSIKYFVDFTPIHATTEWDNIDTLVIGSYSYNSSLVWGGDSHVCIDDIVYNSAAVPVPGTILLLGAGLISLAGVGRKKKI